MKAVIMAGGEGSRLRPLTCDRPKPLVPVCNRPVMAYILDLLALHGFQEVFVTLGYRPGAVHNYFGENYKGMRLHHIVEESPLGTAGSVAALRAHLDDTFLVISGDGLTDIDLTDLLAFHRQAKAVATLAMIRVENPLEYGVIITDRQGRIRRFLEKPAWSEVFSDTINTGIYVLEPEVLNGVPTRRMYDFSQHLFPSLLHLGAPLYGKVAEGYWCDIGDPAAYLQANLDLLAGRLRFKPPGREVAPGVWVSSGEAPEGLQADGPVLIGEGCRLAAGTRLEAGAVLGPATVVGAGSVLRRTVTWSGVHVGADATLVGALVCGGAVLEDGAGVFDGAVIGPNCLVGARAAVAPGVRLWPRTEVSPGARVETTLVQSPVWSGRLLKRGSIMGRLGSELFPENALRAGTAFASIIGGHGPVVVGGDPGSPAGLLKQAITCGVLAAGRNVADAGVTASPVTEYAVRRLRAAGGIHIRWGKDQARVLFYDSQGRPAPRDLQRKLEQVCSRQDFLRATHETTGSVECYTQAEWLYLEQLGEQVDMESIRAARLPVELQGESWPVLNRWLDRLRCKQVARGGHLSLAMDPLEGQWRLGGAEPGTMLALDLLLSVRGREKGTEEERVPIPVTATRMVEELIRSGGRTPVRVRQSDWRPLDPLLSIGRLLEWMAREQTTAAEILAQLPQAHTASRAVACPWEAKGRVMRRLLEEQPDGAVELVDGLRIRESEGWALLLPDPDEPLYRVYTEAQDAESAEALAEQYGRKVQELLS